MSKTRRKVIDRRPAAPSPGRTGLNWRPAALLAAAVLVYANSLSGPFVFDDRGTLVDNHSIERLTSADVLNAPHETPVAGRPVVNVSFALNYAFGGRDVTGYHAVNILIHALCALALFGIVRRTQPSSNAAFAVALLWVVHPLNSEAVNYLTQRTESLMALFYLLTVYFAIRDRKALAIAACALGMASKESMVTAPLVVLLYDLIFRFPSLKAAFAARWRLYAGLAATWLVLAAMMWSAPRNLSAGFTAHDANVWTYLLNQTVMIARYLWLTIWPRDLVLYYGWPLPLTPADVIPQAALVLSLLAATFVALWRSPRAGFLGAWFFIMLAPTSSIVPIATEVGAERRMYLAVMAIIVLAVFVWRRFVTAEAARAGALAVASLLLAAGTIVRNEEYRSSLRLAETTHVRWPTPASRSMYGTELAAAGRLEEAEALLREAAAVHPPAAYYLGTVLVARDKHAEAIDHLKAYIASQPRELDQVYLARGVLAKAYQQTGQWEAFESELRSMLVDRPDDVKVMGSLAPMLLSARRIPEAIDMYQRMLAVSPNERAALEGLAVTLASEGRIDEAIPYFQRVVALDPSNPRAQQNLQRALGMRGR